MSFWNKKNKSKISLIIELQSSIARGYLVNENPDMEPKIIYKSEKEIIYRDHSGTKKYIDNLISAIREITEISRRHLYEINSNENSLEIPTKISEIHIVMSSPWILSQSKKISSSFDKYTTIDRKIITSILEEQRKNIIEDNANPVTIVEEKVLDVKLNGYSIASWLNQKTKELEINYVVSVSGSELIKNITDICKNIVPEKQIYFHSSIILQHVGIKHIFEKISSYILIHIHGEITDIGIIKDDACLFFGSFPFGTRTIVEEIQEKTSTNYQTADSLLTLYENHTLDSSDPNNYEKIRKISQEWTDQLKNILTESKLYPNISKNIIISSDTHRHLFIDTMSLAFSDSTNQTFEIHDILPKAIHNVHIK